MKKYLILLVLLIMVMALCLTSCDSRDAKYWVEHKLYQTYRDKYSYFAIDRMDRVRNQDVVTELYVVQYSNDITKYVQVDYVLISYIHTGIELNEHNILRLNKKEWSY